MEAVPRCNMADLGMCEGQGRGKCDCIKVLIKGPKLGQLGSYSTCNTIYTTLRVIVMAYGMLETICWGAGMESFPWCTQLTTQSVAVIMWVSKKGSFRETSEIPHDDWGGDWVFPSHTKSTSTTKQFILCT